MKTLEAHKDSHKEVSEPFSVATGKAIWTCWRNVAPVRLNRQTCWAILAVEQIGIKSPEYEETGFVHAETVRKKVEAVRAAHVDLELSGVAHHCLLISQDFSAHSGRGWDTVGKKCMFNYFLEHAGGTMLPLSVQVRIQNVLENTKAVFK